MTEDSITERGIPSQTNLSKKSPFKYSGKVEDQARDIARGHLEEASALNQGLQQRHIQMIALAGAIGTGLFLGSRTALANGGLLGAFLGYTVTGVLAAGVVLVAGEMATLVPLSGGTVRFAELFADPALAFAYGWNNVYSYLASRSK